MKTKMISIRLPVSLINDYKNLAEEYGVGYQYLMKVYLRDMLKKSKKFNHGFETTSTNVVGWKMRLLPFTCYCGEKYWLREDLVACFDRHKKEENVWEVLTF